MFDFMYHIPNWGVFITCVLVVFAALCCGAALMALMHVIWPIDIDKPGMVSTILSGILLPTGIVIAFVASDIWQQDTKGRTAVEQEAAAISDTFRVATRLPAEDRDAMSELLDSYIQEVVANEWPLMADGGQSRQAEAILEAMLTNIFDILQDPDIPAARFQGEALRHYVSSIEEARNQRLLVSHSRVSLRKWVTVFALLFVAAGVLYELHYRDRRALFMSMLLLAIGFGATLYLVASYDRPFTGATIIEPDRLAELLIRG